MDLSQLVERRPGHCLAETLGQLLAGQLRLADCVSPGPAQPQLRVLGGAMARVPADATAFAHRGSPIMVNVAALVQSRDELAEHTVWVDGLTGALRQGDTGAYVAFLGDEGKARVRAAYPGPTWDRLTENKRRYDPTNLFRLNQNIPPAGDGR